MASMNDVDKLLILCIVLLLLTAGILVLIALLYSKVLRRETDDLDTRETILLRNREETVQVNPNAWSVLLQDMETLQQYRVVLRGAVILGRSVEERPRPNDLGIGASEALSRKQFQLYVYEGRIYLYNLSQTNITRLNNQMVSGPMLVVPGDVILAGDVLLKVIQIQFSAF